MNKDLKPGQKGIRKGNYGPFLCNKCHQPYNPEELPLSLRNKLRRCRKCYLEGKKTADELWYISIGLTKRKYERKLKQKKVTKNWEG